MIEAEVENTRLLKGKKVYFKKEDELNRHEVIQIDYDKRKKKSVSRK